MTGFFPQLEITTSARCSVDCRLFCPQNTVFKSAYEPSTKFLSLPDFKLAIRTVPKDVWIAFAGFSEPFMNHEAIDMMEYARSEGHKLTLFSTLVGLTKEGIERIRNANPEVFVLHTPDNRGIAHIPDTDNYRELLSLAFRRLNVTGTSIMSSNFESNERAGNCEKVKPRHVRGPIMCRKLDHPEFVMLPDLRVVGCCMAWSLEWVVGSLRLQTFQEIIDGAEYQRVRRNRLALDGDTICRRCKWATPVLSGRGLKEIGKETLMKIGVIQ
jgi:Iron-sulfur cluster-binding domain